jgi:hypothetical protein
MPIETLPTDLQQTIAAITRNEGKVDQTVKGLSAEQLNWQPNDGKGWSILQCLDHLTLSNQKYLGAMWPALRSADPRRSPRKEPYTPGLIARLFVWSLEPPVKFKAPAPNALAPKSSGDPGEVLAAWEKTHEDIRAFVNEAAGFDLNLLTMRNPLVNQLTLSLGTALAVIPAHERRHIWQAGKVRASLDAAKR